MQSEHGVMFCYVFLPFVGLLEYELGVKTEWPTIMAVTDFLVVTDRSHHGYVSTSRNKKVFCQKGYLRSKYS